MVVRVTSWLVAATLSRVAYAEDVPATGTCGRAEAQRAFASGTAAFGEGQYLRAAERFERAYDCEPHPDALYNAAVAWQRASVFDRAANDFARYLREAPADAPDGDKATTALNELKGVLGRFEIDPVGAQDVRLDHRPISARSIYVTPGTHELEARSGNHEIAVTRSVGAGEEARVTLDPSAKAEPEPPPGAASTTPHSSVRPPAHQGGWPREVVYAGAGLTAALLGATIASGVDTSNARRSFNQSPTEDALDEGRAKETRTNALFYASIGVAALTAVTALWLVDWHTPSARTSARAAGRLHLGAGCARVVW
jgi:hypothetical protein